MFRRMLAAAAVLLVAGGLFAWLLSSPSAVPVAFAQVKEAVKTEGPLTCRQTTKVKGEVEETITMKIAPDGRCRIDQEDGSYTIMDPVKHRALVVDPGQKQARLMLGLNTPSLNLYELLSRLPDDAAARPLPGKKLDGREVLGFEVPVSCKEGCLKGKNITLTVWADPKTRLPVRIETSDKDDKGNAVDVVVDQIVFEKRLAPDVFALEPPPGYKLKTEGIAELPEAPADPKLKDLVLTPRKGVGPVEFGMSREQVEKALGKADGVEEMGKSGSVSLTYASRGLFIAIGKTRGVMMITAAAQPAFMIRLRDFSGKTDKGIGLGASVAEVVKAYGEPTRKETKEGSTYVTYDKLQTWFTFFDDKLVQITLNFPR